MNLNEGYVKKKLMGEREKAMCQIDRGETQRAGAPHLILTFNL